MTYALYPCCSSEHMALAYAQSAKAVMDVFDITLTDIPDWNCCGATEYLSLNRLAHYALSARNLALVPEGCSQVITSCSLCYLNLRRADEVMLKNPGIKESVNAALAEGGVHYEPGGLRIRHLLDIFFNDIGLEVITSKVTSPLAHVRVAPFYGCMLTRPRGGFDHPEYPTSMDRLLSALGATVVDFTMKASCCGGHMPHIKTTTAYELLRRILKDAAACKADIIAVSCPVCQMNLDAYQEDVNSCFSTSFSIPVLFFPQLIGLAFGIDPLALGIGKEIVSAEPVLSRRRGGSPGAGRTGTRRDSGTALPMPRPWPGDAR
ncbi:MAG: CoB--CoM heterodisulfide reductase iron-sulfur subunit B family protein [Nitrospirota bacterium]